MTTTHNISDRKKQQAKLLEQDQIQEYDRDKVLKEIVDGNHCSPRSLVNTGFRQTPACVFALIHC